MKIGLSYSRCIRDIVDGKVDIDDVLVLITRTDFDPRDADQRQGIWLGYGGGTENAYSQGFFSQSNPVKASGITISVIPPWGLNSRLNFKSSVLFDKNQTFAF